MDLFLIAGEASGDMHGANLMKAISAKKPDARFRGFGGERMQEAGMQALRTLDKLNFMGFLEVVKNLSEVRKNFNICRQSLQSDPPDALVLIDYPGFNLRMARWAKRQGIRVIYYISPQVWAWKRSRVRQMKKHLDRLLVILPFEKEFFHKEGMEADFVGHPLIDEIGQQKQTSGNREEPIIALLPGSRPQEIRHILPEMLNALGHFPEYRFLIGKAPGTEPSFYRKNFALGKAELFEEGTYKLLSRSSAALVASGTATLETGLMKVPQVVCYKASGISVRIARSLIKVPYISLVNLILGRPAVKELIQDELNAQAIVEELEKLLTDSSALQKDYDELWKALGGPGASRKAADLIIHDLE